MRYFHLARIGAFGLLLRWLGLVIAGVGILLTWLGVGEDFSWHRFPLYVGIAIAGIGQCLLLFFEFLMRAKLASAAGSPLSLDGTPVTPTNIWIASGDPLQIGQPVLVFWEGEWYRAIIIELMSRERVRVHYLGWDDFWDDIQPRAKLQVIPARPASNPIETGICEL